MGRCVRVGVGGCVREVWEGVESGCGRVCEREVWEGV